MPKRGYDRLEGRAATMTSAITILAGVLAAGSHSAAAQTATADTASADTASAQTTAPQNVQPTKLEEVQITGTRIVRDGYKAPTPVTVLGPESLNALAEVNIADAVNKLPELMGSVTPRSQPAGVSGGTQGVNELNLRGLGTDRTLVLLDGKRVINSSINSTFSAPDINSIPQGLVSRVDVVTGGASAAYGSDALAGVVNFVLDRDFVGFKGTVEGGITTYGDDAASTVSLTWGTPFADGRGHFLLSGDTDYNDGIRGNHRPWNADSASVMVNPNYTATNGLPFYLVGRQIGLSNGTPGGLITRGPLKGVVFGPGGMPSMFNYGLVSTNNVMSGGDWRQSRIDDGLDLDARLNRQTAFTRLSYDITDNVELYAEGQFAYARASSTATPNRRLDNLTIQPDNAFIPASIAAQLAALQLPSFTLGTTNGDIGRIFLNNTRTLNRWDLGASGKFDVLGANWSWDAYYQQSATGIDMRALNDAITGNYLLAVDAVRNPATGAVVCRSTLTHPGNGCVPYDAMGTGVNTPAAISYVTGTAFGHDYLRQDVGAASVHGEPFSTWAGPVSAALGIEHRRESLTGFAPALDEANAFFAGNYHASQGAYEVTEGFVETVVPLAKDLPFAKALDLNAAARATDYTTSGYVTTWKAGAVYTPIDDIRFRVTRSRDIRAPNVGELFSAGQASSGAPIFDPFTQTQITNSIALSAGNPRLKPEVAATTGFGVVVSPAFIPGFQASVDYYKIDISGAVQIPNAQSVVNLCFEGDAALCAGIQRTAGVITQIIISPSNLQSQKTDGLDIEASYMLPLSNIGNSWNGDIEVRALGTYVMSLETIDPTLGVVRGAGVLGDTLSGFASTVTQGLASAKLRALASVAYENDAVSATWIMHYVGAGVYNTAFVSCASGCPAGGQFTINDNHIASSATFDLALSYEPGKNTDLFLTVENILNRYPPLIGGNTASTYYTGQGNLAYDRIGRDFRAGIRFKM